MANRFLGSSRAGGDPGKKSGRVIKPCMANRFGRKYCVFVSLGE